MLTIKGTYDGKVIKPLKHIPTKKKLDVLITILGDSHSKKDTAKQYKTYYQQLTTDDLTEDATLANEFQPLDNETDHILEEQES